MKIRTSTMALCLSLMLFCVQTEAYATDVPYEKPILSPNGRFTARLVGQNEKMDVDHLEISDDQTEELAVVGVLSPL